jgi:hypothetical protein
LNLIKVYPVFLFVNRTLVFVKLKFHTINIYFLYQKTINSLIRCHFARSSVKRKWDALKRKWDALNI